jgi:hypothetical protein
MSADLLMSVVAVKFWTLPFTCKHYMYMSGQAKSSPTLPER